ncbi:MAG: hypothetical protein ACE5KV_04475 [Thermoplasmata archaeon]
MRKEFHLEGPVYSRNKSGFKRILKRYGFVYAGSRSNFVWEGKNEKVVAFFERDAERDITISATLIWEGKKKTSFLKELEGWVKDVAGRSGEKPRRGASFEKKIQEELEFWDRLNKPDVARLRAEGRPEDWIRKDLAEWKEKRRKKRKELLERYA